MGILDYDRITPPPHYYGDTVRIAFLLAALLILAIPLLIKDISSSYYIFPGTAILLILVIFAGLTSPAKKFSIIADTFVAGFLFVVFEHLALQNIAQIGTLFMLYQALAALFLVTLYFSIKTWRGMW